MVVDAFHVLGLDLVPGDVRVLVEPKRDVAYEVFDEDWIIVGALGYRLFVRTFEQRENLAAGGRLDYRHEVFNPERRDAARGERDVATLIVRSVIADGIRARAERGDRHRD